VFSKNYENFGTEALPASKIQFLNSLSSQLDAKKFINF
jgi:hypothetical protein